MRRSMRLSIKTRIKVPNLRMVVLRESFSRPAGEHRIHVRHNAETDTFEHVPDRGPWAYVAMTLDQWQCAQGKTRREAVDSLRRLVTSAWHYGWMKHYKPADEHYQTLWKGRHLWTGDDACRKRPEMRTRGQWRKERQEKAFKRQKIKKRCGNRRWDML